MFNLFFLKKKGVCGRKSGSGCGCCCGVGGGDEEGCELAKR
jgi:hypothetical protein